MINSLAPESLIASMNTQHYKKALELNDETCRSSFHTALQDAVVARSYERTHPLPRLESRLRYVLIALSARPVLLALTRPPTSLSLCLVASRKVGLSLLAESVK